MDNPITELRCAPRGAEIGALAAGAVLLGALAGAADPLGRLLGGTAALALLVFALLGAAVRPRLAADRGGLLLRTVTHRYEFGWADVDALTLDERSRFGRTVRTLEIEAGDLLVVLGRYTLGADPSDVHATLLALRAHGRPC